MIEYDKFQMSLKRLEEQHANQREFDASLPELIREAIGLYQTMSGETWD